MSFTLSTLAQPYIALAFVYAGIVMGGLYSIMAPLCRAVRVKWLRIAAECLLTGVCCAVFCTVLYFAVNVRLRFYYIPCTAAGFFLVRTAIRPVESFIKRKLTKNRIDKKEKMNCNDNKK